VVAAVDAADGLEEELGDRCSVVGRGFAKFDGAAPAHQSMKRSSNVITAAKNPTIETMRQLRRASRLWRSERISNLSVSKRSSSRAMSSFVAIWARMRESVSACESGIPDFLR